MNNALILYGVIEENETINLNPNLYQTVIKLKLFDCRPISVLWPREPLTKPKENDMINPNQNHRIVGTIKTVPETYDYLNAMIVETTEGIFEVYGHKVVGKRPGRFKVGGNVTLTVNYSIMAEAYTVNHIKLNRKG